MEAMDHLNEDILRSLLEQRLSPVAQAQVRHHLKTCYRCEQRFDRWRASIDALRIDQPNQAKTNNVRPGQQHTVLVPPGPEADGAGVWSKRITRTVLAVALVLVAALAIDTILQVRGAAEQGAGAKGETVLATTEAALQAGLDPDGEATAAVEPESAGTVDEAAAPEQEESSLGSGATVDAAPAPPSVPAAEPAVTEPLPTSPGFRRISVAEAIAETGGPIKLIGGLYPDHVEIAEGAAAPPGALPGTPVIRVVYREPPPDSRVLHLDQQQIPEGYRAGFSTDTLIDAEPGGPAMAVWVSGTTRLSLSGQVAPDILRILLRRVQ